MDKIELRVVGKDYIIICITVFITAVGFDVFI